MQNVGVHLLNEFHETSQHSLFDGVGVGVGFDFGKHLVVRFPVVLERDVVFDDQVDDVEVGEHRAEIVEDGVVHLLLEVLLVQRMLVEKETVHLKQAILGEEHDLL